jgi:chaperone required for assembly of F1-ATPase
MKRVYREVRVAPAGDGWSILLDARRLQTPARAPLLLPRRGLAEAIAAEWDAQTEKVVPATKPLMRDRPHVPAAPAGDR